jgi:uncharacterized glyoxalase superfamily protein PhnB
MLHVPDVAATASWYESIGFAVRDLGEDGSEVVWASLAFGASELMLNAGGGPSDAHRREADLYLHVDDLDAAFARLAGKAEVVEAPHDTFYGMREFIVRDPNRFWLTFGQRL